MLNKLKYPILALVLFCIFKLIEVTIFDAKKYASRKEEVVSVYKVKEKPGDKSVAQKEKPAPKSSKASKPARSTKKEDTSFLAELKKNYLAPIQAELPPDGLRKDIFIRYYRHNKDGIGVYKLEEMGYYMHQKPATETAGLGSNIIYYGDNVPLEDIQIVALTLLAEGIPIKSIQHTKFEWKSNAIEIGTDSTLLDEPNISEEAILDFDKQYLGGSLQ